MCTKGSKVTASKRPFMRNCGHKKHLSQEYSILIYNPWNTLSKAKINYLFKYACCNNVLHNNSFGSVEPAGSLTLW